MCHHDCNFTHEYELIKIFLFYKSGSLYNVSFSGALDHLAHCIEVVLFQS